MGGTPDQIADAINSWTGGDMTTYGALDQETLDFALTSGRPVVMAVYWDGGGGHALVIGGCQDGGYWVHDPWGWYDNAVDEWQWLPYDGVLRYYVNGYTPGYYGSWTDSVTWNLNDGA